MQNRSKRRLLLILTLLVALAGGGFAAWQYAIRTLKAQIEQALGPRGEVREIRVGLAGVEILDIRIRAPKNGSWPAEDELRAQRIQITPNVLDLLSAKVSLDGIRIEGAYVSMLRTRTGQMKIIPSLLEAQDAKPKESPVGSENTENKGGIPISIDRIIMSGGIIEVYDASVRATPVKLRLEQIEATVGKLRLPELTGQTTLKVDGVIKGNRQDGKLAIDGSIELATKESGMSAKLRGVDMTVLQPYLIQAAETGIKRGTLDLDLKSSVTGGKLRAPGTLTLSDLELTSGSGTFMGLPRSAAVGLLKNNKGKIAVKFVLEGDINDPRFSLNEHLATRLATSLAGSLGVSVESLAKGVGSVGGSTAKAIGESVGKLFGK